MNELNDKSPMHGTFRMKPLPKKEYLLMKALIQRYDLTGPTECIAIMLKLTHEVYRLPHGKQWLINVINHFRSTPQSEIEYPLD